MASGPVCRTQRPNTWLHRPRQLHREESSCQLGAVHTWHLAENPNAPAFVCYWTKADKTKISARNDLPVNDPKRILPVSAINPMPGLSNQTWAPLPGLELCDQGDVSDCAIRLVQYRAYAHTTPIIRVVCA